MCLVSPHFLSILTTEVSLGHQEHTLKIGWKEVTRGGKQVKVMWFFVQESHLDVAFFLMTLFDDWHTLLLSNSQWNLSLKLRKNCGKSDPFYRRSCYNFSHSLVTAVCRYSKYYRCSYCERTSLTSGFD